VPEVVHNNSPTDRFFLGNQLDDESSQKFHPKFK